MPYLPHAVAVVGLESSVYMITEDMGLVEVCAILYSPNITCPVEFPFTVNLSTSDGTAGKHCDQHPMQSLDFILIP